jgi:hypothetical protein
MSTSPTTTTPPPTTDAAEKLHSLLHQALQEFHIEYNGYFTNHISQGLIALYRLGATAERLQEFYDHYLKATLDSKVVAAIPSEHRVNANNYGDFLGQNMHFLDYVDFFSEQISQHGVNKTVTHFMAELYPGVCSAAFHSLIQLGYGADVHSCRVMAEGLAYVCYSFEPYFSPRLAVVSRINKTKQNKTNSV